MKYFLIILLFFIGCEKKESKKSVYIEDVIKQTDENKTKVQEKITNEKTKIQNKIMIGDLKFIEKDGEIIYSFPKTKILVFIDENKFSKLQLKELKKLNHKFYIVKNQKLQNYFKIINYPTIIILDKKKIKKYDGFIPSEILKYEIKD